MEIEVNYYAVKPRRVIAGTTGSYGFESLDFKFDAKWRGLRKTITFYLEGGEEMSLAIAENSVMIPREVMARAGTNKYTVCGYSRGKALVSLAGEIEVLRTEVPEVLQLKKEEADISGA